MGFAKNIQKAVTATFKKEAERNGAGLARGGVVPRMPDGSGMVTQYADRSLQEYLTLDADLLSRMADYEAMDDYSMLSTALDVYADDATQPDTQRNKTLWATAKDRNMELVLNELFDRQLRLNDDNETNSLVRELCKYGNDYEEMIITDEGVRKLQFLPAPTMRRIERPDGELAGFVQDFDGRTGYTLPMFDEALKARRSGLDMNIRGGGTAPVAFEPWEVVHFRLRGKFRRSNYGHSVFEPARWIWKRLMLLEDAAMLFRLQRAPERYAFYCDIGQMPPQEGLAYLNQVRQMHRKRRFINPNTGRLDLRWEPLVQDEDIYIPVREGVDSTRVEVLGSPAWQSMDDIGYFQNQLFSAIKIPKAYLGYEEGVAKAVLSSEDVRFARTILRIQREFKNGMRKVSRVHLAALGINPWDVDYELWMTVPSSIFELAQIEVLNARADLAGRMQAFVSLHWTLSKIFGLSDDEIQLIIKEKDEDAERLAKQQQMLQPPMPGGPGGGPQMPGMPDGQDDQDGAEFDANSTLGMTPDEAAQNQESVKRFRSALVTETQNRRVLRGRLQGGISEAALFQGSNRETEKRAEERFEKLMRSDKVLASRLNDIQGLLQDIRGTSARAGMKRGR